MLVPVLLSILLQLALAQHAASKSITAWYSKGASAPQVMMYDETNGKIYYSLCNSKETPVFPHNDENTLELDQKPIRNTSIAGIAGPDGTAMVHYQEEGVGIVQAMFHCDTVTGRWTRQRGQSFIVTGGAPVVPSEKIEPGTGLAVVAPRKDDYRIFYKNNEHMPKMVEYKPNGSGGGNWYDGGFVSQDNYTALALSAGFLDDYNITVAVPRNDGLAFEVMSKSPDGPVWNVGSARFTMFESNQTAKGKYSYRYIGSATNDLPLYGFNNKTTVAFAYTRSSTGQYLRNHFYIGEDLLLYHITGDGDDLFAVNNTRQTSDIWPNADDPNARLAVTSDADVGDIWLYYMSGGTMVQASMSNGQWQPAVTLEKTNSNAPGDGTTGNSESGSASSGLSQSQKIGIGVGVGLGAALIIAALVWYFLSHRRSTTSREPDDQESASKNEKPAESQQNGRYNEAPDNGISEMSASKPPSEMLAYPPVYEMLHVNREPQELPTQRY